MTHTRTNTLVLLAALFCALAPSAVHAQDDDRARSLLAEAQGHEDEERYALAGQRYLELYDVMEGAEMERAPVALWSAGNALSRVPGQEREAIGALRRFLDTSSALAAEDEQIRQWRTTSEGLIAELEARIPDEPEPQGSEGLDAPQGDAPPPPEYSDEQAGHISPVGPVVLAVGGAALLAGVVIGAVSLVQDADFRDACDDLTMCPTALRPQYDEMRAFSTAADVLLVAGGAVAVLGLVLTLTLTDGEDEPVAASAVCTGDGCYGSVGGTF